MASRSGKFHGRVDGAEGQCAVPGCGESGEYKAPVEPANFNGPGTYCLLCLDHVRAHNARYNYFHGMSVEEITEAQSPLAGWERPRRGLFSVGDPGPAWSDFADPLEAIAARFRRAERPERVYSFNRAENRALAVLGLGEDVDLHAVRQRYSKLVRRYHPDRNGGDRSHEDRLRDVIEAWQTLKGAAAFA